MKKQIDLNKLTVQELKLELQKLDTQKEVVAQKGKTYCIVRTYSAGVFAGLYDRKIKGKEGTVYKVRRIFYWEGAASLSQLANEGVKVPDKCKFAQEVEEIDLKEVIEVIPCTAEAEKNIKGVQTWER